MRAATRCSACRCVSRSRAHAPTSRSSWRRRRPPRTWWIAYRPDSRDPWRDPPGRAHGGREDVGRKGATVPEQEQKRIQKKGGSDDAAADDAGQVAASSKAAELKDEMDEILDEIDSVLAENAEEFVKSYVQKGGQ